MRLSLQPIRLATDQREEGALVFVEDRLVAVLTRLSNLHEDLGGHWFVEVAFGALNDGNHSVFGDIGAVEAWITRAYTPAAD